MEEHQCAVAKLSEEIASFYQRKETFRIYHGSTNCTRQISLDPSKIIDTSNLNHILECSSKRKVVTCEPNVSMDVLVRETLKLGLIPPVIPEFPGISVGGAFAGTAGESSSFKYGYFDRTVNSIEIILADGEVVTASQKDDRKDLFNGSAGGFGSFGTISMLEIELIEAKKYVELTYIPVGNSTEALKEIQASCMQIAEEAVDFVDGIQFSTEQGVVCVGRMTDICEGTPQGFSQPWDPWFYAHARSRASSGSKEEPFRDTIPLQDYLFRYDRGAFWMGDYYPLFAFSFLNNRMSRWMCDSFLHTRFLFQSMHISKRSQRFIIQDFGLPSQNAEEFLDFVNEQFGIYPLWLCPIQTSTAVNMQRIQDTSFPINIGVWGPGSTNFATFVSQNRELEQKLAQLGGRKWLYAHTYYTAEEFWSIYDKDEYEIVRRKYKAEMLLDVYTKVKSTEVEHPKQDLKAILYGLYGHFGGFSVKYLL